MPQKLPQQMRQNAFILIVWVVLLVSMTNKPALAQEAPEKQETATTSSELVGEELTKRIQKVLIEKREQVKGALDSLLTEKKALIGEVIRITDDAISTQYKDRTTIIPLTKNVMLLKNDKEIPVSEITVGNWVTVLGNKDRTTVEPEYVIVSAQSLLPKKQWVVLGNITATTKTSLSVQPRSGEALMTIELPKTVSIESANGEPLAMAKLTKDLAVLITATETTNGTIQAQTVRSLAPLE